MKCVGVIDSRVVSCHRYLLYKFYTIYSLYNNLFFRHTIMIYEFEILKNKYAVITTLNFRRPILRDGDFKMYTSY